MSARYLLDANVLSEPCRPAPDARTMKKLLKHDGELATCSVVWHELLFGVARLPTGRRKTALRAYLDEVVHKTLPIFPYDEVAAAWHAAARARLAAAGKTPGFADGQIAAVAAVNGLIVVTRNARHYEFFSGIRVEKW
ncbi:MAG: type II toxin-antitoxin system VapC family toxin [Deltaproteobacteria bacterium]|nr:type II toxin-antitoxin system VapC family toxin [Deltaproteobacteria bacterium]